MDWILNLTASHWVVLGLALLAIDALLGIGYLLGPGVAALVMAVLSAILPLGPNGQLFGFAVLSILATYGYVRFFKRKPGETDSATGLHNRTQAMVGRETLLTEDVTGNARIAFGDTLWRVKSNHTIRSGTRVVVSSVDGDVLVIDPLAP